MSTFSDLKTAVNFDQYVQSRIKSIVSKIRPAPRYATVVSIGEGYAEVRYVGEDSTVRIPYSNVSPTIVGQEVRIEGVPGDRYITAVRGTSNIEQTKTDVSDAVTGGYTGTDTYITSIQDHIAGIDANASDASVGVGQIADNINALGTGSASGTGSVANTFDSVNTLYQNAVNAQNAAIAAQQQLQNNSQNENSGGGLSKILNFSVPGALNSSDWNPSTLVVSSKKQLSIPSSASSGFYLAVDKYTYLTDNQTISTTIGDNPNPYSVTILILRAASDGKSGTACIFHSGQIAIGTVSIVNSGDASIATSIATYTNITQSYGDIIEFTTVGNDYIVKKNGTPVLSYSGSLGSIGSDYRSSSVIKQKATPFLTYYSFDLFNISIYDYGANVSAVVGAYFYQTGSSTSTVTSTSGPVVPPANTFNATAYANGITVTDASRAQCTIDTSGIYEISAFHKLYWSGADSHPVEGNFSVYVNGNTRLLGPRCGDSVRMFLEAGVSFGIGFYSPISDSFSRFDKQPGSYCSIRKVE